MKRRPIKLTVVVPLALIAVSVWLLVGCLYIPTRNMVDRTGAKQDFRPLVGDPGSARPIVVGRISRSGVEAILGPAPFASANHRRVMYVIHVKKDVFIAPLCFTAANDQDQAIGLALNFDDSGLLMDWTQLYSREKTIDLMDGFSGLDAAFAMEDAGDADLLYQANSRGSKSVPSNWILKWVKDAKTK